MPGKYTRPEELQTRKRLYVAGAVIVIAVLFLGLGNAVKVPVTGAVTYTVQEPYDTEEIYTEQECEPVLVPTTERQCTQEEFRYDVTDHRVLKTANPDEPSGWQCIGTFKIVNKEARFGVWRYDYAFTGESGTITKSGFKEIRPNGEVSIEFLFPCSRDEEVSGSYTITEVPTKGEVCKDVTVQKETENCFDTRHTRTVTQYRTVTRERPETQLKTLFEAWFGG